MLTEPRMEQLKNYRIEKCPHCLNDPTVKNSNSVKQTNSIHQIQGQYESSTSKCKFKINLTKYKNCKFLPSYNIQILNNVWASVFYSIFYKSQESCKVQNVKAHFKVNTPLGGAARRTSYLTWHTLFLLLCACAQVTAVALPTHKYSTRVVRTKYGTLRGLELRAHPPVEAFLGVPYATPPLGSLRYMPPVTPSPWRGTRLADKLSAVCPQNLPDIAEPSDGLLKMPRARIQHLQRLLPLLTNQSEDCLYLNLYVPKMDTPNTPLTVLVFIHGESYSWNSGNPYDGSALAGKARLLVVTVNYRLGVLGFLKTGGSSSAQGNFGLMDLVAALHWLREAVPAFGGDPENLTLMGHGTGGALANILSVSPVAEDLVRRAILLSGCALAPWAVQREPLAIKRKVAEATGCHGDLLGDDIAPCLRGKSLEELLAVTIEPPRFLAGFAPFIDGTVLPLTTSRRLTLPQGSALADTSGLELADFPAKDLMLSVTSTESYLDLSAQDLEFGFNETRRDKILRTFVRNIYHYHLNEIFSALKNEYTDWERPSSAGFSARDSALELLSDGHGAAPLLRLAQLHSLRGGKGYFVHFRHQSRERDFPQRFGSVLGEDLPYVLALPGLPLFLTNLTTRDHQVGDKLAHYIGNFARTGNPNGPYGSSTTDVAEGPDPFWDSYDTINQLYLELGGTNVAGMRSHYRGHKLSAWLSLIPQLHGESADDVPARHHHFQEEGPQYYDGSVRPQNLQRLPPRPTSKTVTQPATSTKETPSVTPLAPTTTECPNNTTLPLTTSTKSPASNNLLRRLASSHYQSYTTALSVTVAVGCFLLLLNVLIFAGIYHQRGRGRRRQEAAKKALDPETLEKMDSKSSPQFGEYSCYDEKLSSCLEKRPLADVALCSSEMQLQEFRKSPPGGMRRLDVTGTPSRASSTGSCSESARSSTTAAPPDYLDASGSGPTDIPDPPPPPRQMPPQTGILRAQSGTATPAAGKKRVQIQEISV